MTGHWEMEGYGYEFEPNKYVKRDMFEQVLEEGVLDEVDFERYLNDEFTAAQIVFSAKDFKSADELWMYYWDCFTDSMFYDVGEPVEGQDFCFCNVDFKWIEDEEEDEE